MEISSAGILSTVSELSKDSTLPNEEFLSEDWIFVQQITIIIVPEFKLTIFKI